MLLVVEYWVVGNLLCRSLTILDVQQYSSLLFFMRPALPSGYMRDF